MSVSELNHWISQNVRTLLAYRGLNGRALEEALGVDSSTVSRLLHDKRGWTPDYIYAAAELLDVSLDMLFGDPEALLRNRCFSLNNHAPPDMSSTALVLA